MIKGKDNILGQIYSDKINLNIGDIIEFDYKYIEVEGRRIFNTFDYKKYLKSINIKHVVEIGSYHKVNTNKLYEL